MTENNQPIETIEIPDEAIEDFIDHGAGLPQPSYHTLLEVWSKVLEPAVAESTAQVHPAWANRIITSYPEVRYADMIAYRDSYFAKILELVDILDAEIASDSDCLTYDNAEDDAEHNTVHYKNLLLLWQMAVLSWEQDWDCTDELAGVELAAISEVHKMFFGPTSLVSHLDQIQFEFTEADQAMLTEALEEMKVGRGE